MSSYRQTAIAAVRMLSKLFVFLLAGIAAAPSSAALSSNELRPRGQTLRVFFDELGSDQMLRARFARNPRAVLGERGLDLLDLAVPDRICALRGRQKRVAGETL